MSHTRPNPTLLLGIFLSLTVHLWLLLPLFMTMLKADRPEQLLKARFNPEDFIKTPPEVPDDQETPLGIDDGTPSTLTWIGYEEYQEHIAALAAQDQAAFSDQPVPAGRLPSGAPSETVEVAIVQEQEQAVPEPIVSEITEEQLLAFQNFTEVLRRFLPEIRPPSQKAPTPTQESPTPSEPAPVAPEAPQAPVAPDDTTPPDPGEDADRESDPTSIIEALPEHWKIGKPLAAIGLEIKTRKPEFTVLQLLTTAPRNPLGVIRFGADGKPVEAKLTESSGNEQIDSVILASLYRWRAKGKRLEELAKGETADVSIRIVLRSNR